MINKMGIYKLQERTLEIKGINDKLHFMVITDSITCEIPFDIQASVYHKFFVYPEMDSIWWLYSGDIGLYQVSFPQGHVCNIQSRYMSLKKTQIIPEKVLQLLDD